MKTTTLSRLMLLVMGLYDALLGAAFLVAAPPLFERMNVTPPNHWGYVHFAASLLIVFSLMFFAAALAPRRNRNLIPYCVGLKLCYSGVVFYHWFLGGGLPALWKPFALADLVMAALLVWIYFTLRPASSEA